MNSLTKVLFTFGIALLFAPSVQAQAYCALRDPISSIQEFAPNASGHQSIVELVGGSARKDVAGRLPFTIHFNELGKHTLYVVLKNGKPAGFLHARSEKGKWGLVEIVWYFDLDLKVKNFKFQRCRDGSKREIASKAFVSQLRNKGFDELRQMLSDDGQSIADDSLNVSPDAAPLALSSLQSALKTIAVTEIVWKEHLPRIRKAAGYVSSPPAPADPATIETSATSRTRSIKIENVYSEAVMQVLASIQQEEEWIVQRKSVEGVKRVDSDGKLISIIVQTCCTAQEDIVTLSWTIDPTGKVLAVESVDEWPDKDIKEAFGGLEGLSLDQVHNCSTAAQLAAAEVLAISKVHLRS